MRAVAACLVALLVGCAQPVPTPVPTPPSRPEVPEGWQVVTTEAEDVTLVLPEDFAVLNTRGAIGASREEEAGREELIVSVIGPERVEQREAGETLDDWITQGNWLTAGRGEPGAITRREVLLPAGPALEVTAGFKFGEEDRWTMLHIVDTGRGYAVLQFDGGGPAPIEPSAEVRLIRELVTFER